MSALCPTMSRNSPRRAEGENRRVQAAAGRPEKPRNPSRGRASVMQVRTTLRVAWIGPVVFSRPEEMLAQVPQRGRSDVLGEVISRPGVGDAGAHNPARSLDRPRCVLAARGNARARRCRREAAGRCSARWTAGIRCCSTGSSGAAGCTGCGPGWSSSNAAGEALPPGSGGPVFGALDGGYQVLLDGLVRRSRVHSTRSAVWRIRRSPAHRHRRRTRAHGRNEFGCQQLRRIRIQPYRMCPANAVSRLANSKISRTPTSTPNACARPQRVWLPAARIAIRILGECRGDRVLVLVHQLL